MNDNSEEQFLGFDPENLENDEGTMPFVDTWVRGNLDMNYPEFRGEKKMNVGMGEDSQLFDFFRLFISDYFTDDVLVRETNKYAADFFNFPQRTFIIITFLSTFLNENIEICLDHFIVWEYYITGYFSIYMESR